MSQIIGAGCLFIQNNYILVGYTPKRKIWSGIGGKIEGKETLRQTAIREMLEELFGFVPTIKIINDLDKLLISSKLIIRENYGILPISFDLYNFISLVLFTNRCVSPYYKSIPMKFIELVQNRIPMENAEITELKVVNYTLNNPDIDKNIIADSYFVTKK
jgi:hypothetical protein